VIFVISLGPYDTGLTLAAQLFDTSGSPVGDAITTGWAELGNGHYILTTDLPPKFQGGIYVYDAAHPTFILEAGPLNPPVAHTRVYCVTCGRYSTDLNLVAQFYDDEGTPVGDPYTDIIELGNGRYMLYTTPPVGAAVIAVWDVDRDELIQAGAVDGQAQAVQRPALLTGGRLT
jgi:hypothetical protein